MIFEIGGFFSPILETVEGSFWKKHNAILPKRDFYQMKWLYNNTCNI